MAGGRPRKISIKGTKFSIPADSDPTAKTGGMENTVERNSDSSAFIVQENMSWRYTGPIRIISQDQRVFIQDIIDAGEMVEIVVTENNGDKLRGKGIPVGEISHTFSNGQTEITIEGEGKLLPL